MSDAVELCYDGKTRLVYEGGKYECEMDTLRATLEEYGVAVLPSLLSQDEQTAMNEGMWQAIEHYTSGLVRPVRR